MAATMACDDGRVPEQCAECGFAYDLSQAELAGDGVRERIAEVAAILRERDADVGLRSQPDLWSPLEYGCHLRDMLLVQRERVLAARRVDRPQCAPMGREERVARWLAVHTAHEAQHHLLDIRRLLCHDA
jgi:hypothetical protein